MATKYLFVPVPVLKTQPATLGGIDNTCWAPAPRPSGPGPWEEVVTGPNERGEFAVEFRRIVSRTKSRMSRIERERSVAECLRALHRPWEKPVSIRAVENATTIPRATIMKLSVWKQYMSNRAASASSADDNLRLLTDDMLVCINSGSRTPLEILTDEEAELASLIADQAEDIADSRRSRRRPSR